MYNYYSELKKLNDYESQVINNEKEAEIKEHRKSKIHFKQFFEKLQN